jgi:hypothetical protein
LKNGKTRLAKAWVFRRNNLYRAALCRPVVHQEVFGMNDGDILELIESRRSIGSFLNKEVPHIDSSNMEVNWLRQLMRTRT